MLANEVCEFGKDFPAFGWDVEGGYDSSCGDAAQVSGSLHRGEYRTSA